MTSWPKVNKRVQTQNPYKTLQEYQTISNIDKQVEPAKAKLQAEQQSE